MKYFLTAFTFFILTYDGFCQGASTHESNKRFSVIFFGGAANSFDDSADDHYQAGIKLATPYALHIKAGMGTRPVEPLTHVFFAGVEYDLYRVKHHRAYVTTSIIHLYRRTHNLFDDRVWKQTIGAGYHFMPFKRFGLGVEYCPIGLYHGTRKDNQEKGNPSLTGAGEFHVNLLILVFII